MTVATPLRLVWIAGLIVGLVTSCFAAPNDDVIFSCEYDGDDQCPPDYRCEMDNCCHRIGSDVEAKLGACALGGNSASSSTTTDTGTGTDTDTSTDGGSDSDTETG